MIQKHYQQIIDELKIISKKTIKKQKRKNQYTIDFKFGSDIQTNTLRNIILVSMQIPQQILTLPQVRFASDIQLPQHFPKAEKLGGLMIDWFSQHYKVRRADTKENMLVISLEAYDIPFVDFDQYYQVLQAKCPQVTKNFKKFQEMLGSFSYSSDDVVTTKALGEFEANILKNSIAQGFVTKVKDKRRTTLAKLFTNKMLDFMCVDEEMIKSYVLETKLLPQIMYIDPDDESQTTLNKCYSSNVERHIPLQMEFVNYNGQRFYIPTTIYRFVIPDEHDDSFIEYSFYVLEAQTEFLGNENIIKENCKDYFNLKDTDSMKSSESNSDTNEQNKLRCGFKSL